MMGMKQGTSCPAQQHQEAAGGKQKIWLTLLAWEKGHSEEELAGLNTATHIITVGGRFA